MSGRSFILPCVFLGLLFISLLGTVNGDLSRGSGRVRALATARQANGVLATARLLQQTEAALTEAIAIVANSTGAPAAEVPTPTLAEKFRAVLQHLEQDLGISPHASDGTTTTSTPATDATTPAPSITADASSTTDSETTKGATTGASLRASTTAGASSTVASTEQGASNLRRKRMLQQSGSTTVAPTTGTAGSTKAVTKPENTEEASTTTTAVSGNALLEHNDTKPNSPIEASFEAAVEKLGELKGTLLNLIHIGSTLNTSSETGASTGTEEGKLANATDPVDIAPIAGNMTTNATAIEEIAAGLAGNITASEARRRLQTIMGVPSGLGLVQNNFASDPLKLTLLEAHSTLTRTCVGLRRVLQILQQIAAVERSPVIGGITPIVARRLLQSIGTNSGSVEGTVLGAEHNEVEGQTHKMATNLVQRIGVQQPAAETMVVVQPATSVTQVVSTSVTTGSGSLLLAEMRAVQTSYSQCISVVAILGQLLTMFDHQRQPVITQYVQSQATVMKEVLAAPTLTVPQLNVVRGGFESISEQFATMPLAYQMGGFEAEVEEGKNAADVLTDLLEFPETLNENAEQFKAALETIANVTSVLQQADLKLKVDIPALDNVTASAETGTLFGESVKVEVDESVLQLPELGLKMAKVINETQIKVGDLDLTEYVTPAEGEEVEGMSYCKTGKCGSCKTGTCSGRTNMVVVPKASCSTGTCNTCSGHSCGTSACQTGHSCGQSTCNTGSCGERVTVNVNVLNQCALRYVGAGSCGGYSAVDLLYFRLARYLPSLISWRGNAETVMRLVIKVKALMTHEIASLQPTANACVTTCRASFLERVILLDRAISRSLALVESTEGTLVIFMNDAKLRSVITQLAMLMITSNGYAGGITRGMTGGMMTGGFTSGMTGGLLQSAAIPSMRSSTVSSVLGGVGSTLLGLENRENTPAVQRRRRLQGADLAEVPEGQTYRKVVAGGIATTPLNILNQRSDVMVTQVSQANYAPNVMAMAAKYNVAEMVVALEQLERMFVCETARTQVVQPIIRETVRTRSVDTLMPIMAFGEESVTGASTEAVSRRVLQEIQKLEAKADQAALAAAPICGDATDEDCLEIEENQENVNVTEVMDGLAFQPQNLKCFATQFAIRRAASIGRRLLYILELLSMNVPESNAVEVYSQALVKIDAATTTCGAVAGNVQVPVAVQSAYGFEAKQGGDAPAKAPSGSKPTPQSMLRQ